MTYFSTFSTMDDMAFIADITPAELDSHHRAQTLRNDLLTLHNVLVSRLKTHNIPLAVTTLAGRVIALQSVTDIEPGGALNIPYTRTKGEALTVERLMGRESVTSARNLNARRHPTIELRLTAKHLALELVISPDAWWDQQNLIGKLTVERHKRQLYSLLRDLDAMYRLGFWQGVELNDMHLTGAHFQHPTVVDEWMSTFDAGTDWFRLGVWYGWDDSRVLSNTDLPAELLPHFQAIYPIYEWLAWTSDNNFREFYGLPGA